MSLADQIGVPQGQGGLQTDDPAGGLQQPLVLLLLGVGSVVGGDELQSVVLQPLDDGETVRVGPQRGVHLGIDAVLLHRLLGEGEVVGSGLRPDVRSQPLGQADQLHCVPGADMLDVHPGPSGQGQHTVSGYHHILCAGGGPGEAQLLAHLPLVHPRLIDQGRVLLVEAEHCAQLFGQDHGLMGHLGVQEGHPVVGEAHSSGPLELRHVHQLLALHPLGHTGGLEDPDPGPLPLLPGAVDGLGAVYGGLRVGHTDDGGVSSPLGGGRAGLHRLLVGGAGVPEVGVYIDQARGHDLA